MTNPAEISAAHIGKKTSARTFKVLLCLLMFSPAGNASHAARAAQNFTGQFLVATAAMRDPRFVQTVIYMIKHNGDGAMGLVINRPVAKGPIADLLQGFGLQNKDAHGDIILHYGGPVSTNTGFVLHSDDVLLDTSTRVKDGIAVTADPRLIQSMSRGKGPRQSLFILGYAGWASGQLENEILADSWYVVPADKQILFGADADKKWQRAVDKRQIPL